jgi:hypothetical protein
MAEDGYESPKEITKRILSDVPTYRLRLTEQELKFILHILKERAETAEDIMRLYGLKKTDERFREQKKVKFVADDMVRRFSGTLEGKKRHFGMRAWWTCMYLVSDWEKQEKK